MPTTSPVCSSSRGAHSAGRTTTPVSLEWKHLENPFGVSPMWIALADDRVVGFRTFLRWQFVTPTGEIVHAVRAVDTATDPDHQGQGIFTRLTLDGLAELPDEGVALVFNTPNEKSLPGYLKMGWRELGRLPVVVQPTSLRFPRVIVTARRSAGRWPLPATAGEDPGDALADDGALEALLASQPPPRGLATPPQPRPPALALRPGVVGLTACCGWAAPPPTGWPCSGAGVAAMRSRA